MTPLEFIQLINKTFPEGYPEHSGGCYKFHLLLRAMYPEAVGYYRPVEGHIITRIYNYNGSSAMYDIKGKSVNLIGNPYYPIVENSSHGYTYNYFNKLFAEYL